VFVIDEVMGPSDEFEARTSCREFHFRSGAQVKQKQPDNKAAVWTNFPHEGPGKGRRKESLHMLRGFEGVSPSNRGRDSGDGAFRRRPSPTLSKPGLVEQVRNRFGGPTGASGNRSMLGPEIALNRSLPTPDANLCFHRLSWARLQGSVSFALRSPPS